MKLLIITQVIDTEHPILGFFHRWVEEFAKHCEHVHVIALQVGKHSLPQNVTVHSLGKEAGKGRLTYLIRFYKLIISLRHEYDSVFVHMNQIYVILGGLFWRMMGKKIGLWYAHGAAPSSLKCAVPLTHIIFTSTPEGFTIPTNKLQVVGQGIDTTVFKPGLKEGSSVITLITVGRISPSKNIATLLKACAIIKAHGVPFTFSIVGLATTDTERSYELEMRALSSQLGLDNETVWAGSVANHALPKLLQSADIFIHDGATNSLDKALLEALFSGCIVISSNPAYRGIASPYTPELLYTPNDHEALAAILLRNPVANIDTVTTLRNQLAGKYSIEGLISGIVGKY